MEHAIGTFEPTTTPQPGTAQDGDAAIGRLVLSKTFQGDLEGSGSGQMLAVRTAVEGSAGYVALERVTGTLQGRSGSFVLQHHGVMHRGTPSLSVNVVPDSGTDGLAGISGTMEIIIADGDHSYDFSYTLSSAS